MTRPCEQCGAPFVPARNNRNKHRFCSPLCQRHASDAKIAPAPLQPPVLPILAAVADQFGLPAGLLQGARRYQPLARTRQLAYLIAKERTGRSNASIGRAFGQRHYQTVKHGVRVAREMCAADATWMQHKRAIEARLDGVA